MPRSRYTIFCLLNLLNFLSWPLKKTYHFIFKYMSTLNTCYIISVASEASVPASPNNAFHAVFYGTKYFLVITFTTGSHTKKLWNPVIRFGNESGFELIIRLFDWRTRNCVFCIRNVWKKPRVYRPTNARASLITSHCSAARERQPSHRKSLWEIEKWS